MAKRQPICGHREPADCEVCRSYDADPEVRAATAAWCRDNGRRKPSPTFRARAVRQPLTIFWISLASNLIGALVTWWLLK